MSCTVGGAVRPGYIPGVSNFGLVCGGVWIASEYCGSFSAEAVGPCFRPVAPVVTEDTLTPSSTHVGLEMAVVGVVGRIGVLLWGGLGRLSY
jgi:hypothetical protein